MDHQAASMETDKESQRVHDQAAGPLKTENRQSSLKNDVVEAAPAVIVAARAGAKQK